MLKEQAEPHLHSQILAEKAEKLRDLLTRKPGQKHYKRSLRAFLEADSKVQKALLDHIERDDGAAAFNPPGSEPPKP